MTSLRSSVRPKSSKQPWGTILEPEFGMGHQRMTGYEVEQTVSRLYYIPQERQRVYVRAEQAKLDKNGQSKMVARLTTKGEVTDAKRTQKHSIYKNMGIVNSFAWKGYN